MNPLRTSIHQRIFSALGATGVLVAACGGEVVVIQDGPGAGGARAGGPSSTTATGTSTTVSTSTGTQPFECDVPLVENARLELTCLPPEADGSCPGEPQGALSQELEGECSDPDVCWCAEQIDEFCGCYSYVGDVPCGPEPVAMEPCCYYALVLTDGFCEGRPFRVQGQVRVAPRVARADWRRAPALALEAISPSARAALADAWARDAAFEHASVASFARHVLELLAVGAPAALVREAQRAVGDEIRHAELCFGLAGAYAGEALGPGALDVAGAEAQTDLKAVAVSVAREGCLHETVAALLAAEACERAEAGPVRAALRVIAEDEGRHAALAWRFVAWACRQRGDVRAAVLETLRTTPLPGPEPMPDVPLAAWNAHGRLSPTQQRGVVGAAWRDVIGPAIGALEGHASQPREVSETTTPSASA